MSRPFQVYLDDKDLARLEAWAHQRGWTKSQAVRVAIRALTRSPADEPLLELSGDIDGLPEDLSEHFDRYLNETFVAEPLGPYRARRRRTRPILVDSGAWIALRSQRDQHHAEADRLFRNALQRGIRLLTTNLVLASFTGSRCSGPASRPRCGHWTGSTRAGT